MLKWKLGIPRLFLFVSFVSSAQFLVALVTGFFFLKFLSPAIATRLPLIYLGLFLTAGCSFLVSELFLGMALSEPLEVPARKVGNESLFHFFILAVSVCILVQAYWGLVDQPLDYDEQNMVYELLYRGWHRLNPLQTETHPIAAASSFLSTKIFGSSKLAERFPALLFTALFLFFFARFSTSRFSKLAALLVFAHLAVNQLFLWYAHSLRGYISLTLGCLLLFWIVFDLTQGKKTKVPWVFFALLFVGVIFTHSFGGMFSIALWIALLAWGAFHKDRMTSIQLKNIQSAVLLGGACLPLVGGLLYVHQTYVEKDPNRFIDASQSTPLPNLNFLSSIFSNWMGSVHLFTPWLFLALVVLVWAGKAKRKDPVRPDPASFVGLFLAIYFLFFLSVFAASHGQKLWGRFFLPVLPLMVLWLGEGVARTRYSYWLAPLVALLLIGVPLYDGKRVTTVIADGFGPYDRFLREVRRITHPTDQVCFEVTGDVQKSMMSVPLYLRPAHFKKESKNCQTNYEIELAGDTPIPNRKLAAQEKPNLLVFDDSFGNRLFKKRIY